MLWFPMRKKNHFYWTVTFFKQNINPQKVQYVKVSQLLMEQIKKVRKYKIKNTKS